MLSTFLAYVQFKLGAAFDATGHAIADSSWSAQLQGSERLWMLLEGTHVLTLMLFAGSILFVDLRLLGAIFKTTPVSRVTDTLLPYTIGGFIVMVLTGTALFFANPLDYYHNVVFRLKLVFLIAAAINIFYFHFRVQADRAAWDGQQRPPASVRRAAAFSLALWIGVIVAGRFAAYDWFSCDGAMFGARRHPRHHRAGACPMTVNLRDIAPSIQPAAEALGNVPVIRAINEIAWIFAVVETGHLLFLAILGGAVLGLNLRLMGLILPDMNSRDVERALRPWYVAGAIGTIGTGVAMAITMTRTLLPNGAFFIKMVALLAAIMLSHVIMRQVRTGRPAVRENAVLTCALILWGASLLLFAGTQGLNSGAMLIGLAGAGILAAASQPHRRPAVIGLFAVAFGAWFFALDGIAQDGTGSFASGSLGNSILAATVLPALGSGVRDIRSGADRADASVKLVAFASTLAWVTVAAAGRWIGFS